MTINKKPKKEIKGVLFDLDGTLLDTSPDMIYALNLILSKYGLAKVDIEAARSCVSYGANALLEFGFGKAWPRYNAMDLRQEYLDTYAENMPVKLELHHKIRPTSETV